MPTATYGTEAGQLLYVPCLAHSVVDWRVPMFLWHLLQACGYSLKTFPRGNPGFLCLFICCRQLMTLRVAAVSTILNVCVTNPVE